MARQEVCWNELQNHLDQAAPRSVPPNSTTARRIFCG